MPIDGRRLLYFVRVAEAGSLGRAAQSLHVAQPALSRQMRLLEDEVGATLFERTARGMPLTAAGATFYADVKRLLSDEQDAMRRARLASGGHLGHLRVGFSEIYLWHPQVLAALRACRAEDAAVTFTIEAMLSGAITDRLRSGHLDLALAYSGQIDEDDPDLRHRPWFTDEYQLAVAVDSPLARQPPACLAELNGEDFILFRRDQSPRMHDMIMGHFHERGFTPRIVQEGTSHHTVLALVAAGLGCSVMPISAKARMPRGVRLMEVADMALRTPIHAVWSAASETPLLRRFMALLDAPVAPQD
ncbi:LysR family transcriptional regulator [Ottowia sp.]|uniref:LysR family transcriptional regulator n=1 Tax=Ottowia sp. TaxID=1898956 RepID=UPI0039E6C5A0